MKKFILLFLIGFSIGNLAFSQDINDEITLMQAEFGMGKKQLVEAVMNLPESVSPGFWIIYQQYEGERQILARERILLINEYLSKYDIIDNNIADFEEFCGQNQATSEIPQKIQKSHYRKRCCKISSAGHLYSQYSSKPNPPRAPLY